MNMLSLSIFCSSQSLSVAIYDEKKLEKFFEKKILDGRIEGIFSIIRECLKKYSLRKIKYIICNNGPGSFTGMRSLKSICQALALSSGAKIYSSSTFIPYLTFYMNKSVNVLVIFKFSGSKFFFRKFKILNKKISSKSDIFVDEVSGIKNFYLKEKEKFKQLSVITDNKTISDLFCSEDVKLYNANAKDLTQSFLGGYCDKDFKIFYHNTYYE